jgi:hypothetical protein
MKNLGKIKGTLVNVLLGTNKTRKAIIKNIRTISKLVRKIQ